MGVQVPVSCAHFQALASGAGLAERNAEFGPGRGREDLSAQLLCAEGDQFSYARANLLLSAGGKPQLHNKRKKKNRLPDFHHRVCKQEGY